MIRQGVSFSGAHTPKGVCACQATACGVCFRVDINGDGRDDLLATNNRNDGKGAVMAYEVPLQLNGTWTRYVAAAPTCARTGTHAVCTGKQRISAGLASPLPQRPEGR